MSGIEGMREGKGGRERREEQREKGTEKHREHWDSSRNHGHNFSSDCEDGTHSPMRAIQLGTGLFGKIRKGCPEDLMAE